MFRCNSYFFYFFVPFAFFFLSFSSSFFFYFVRFECCPDEVCNEKEEKCSLYFAPFYAIPQRHQKCVHCMEIWSLLWRIKLYWLKRVRNVIRTVFSLYYGFFFSFFFSFSSLFHSIFIIQRSDNFAFAIREHSVLSNAKNKDKCDIYVTSLVFTFHTHTYIYSLSIVFLSVFFFTSAWFKHSFFCTNFQSTVRIEIKLLGFIIIFNLNKYFKRLKKNIHSFFCFFVYLLRIRAFSDEFYFVNGIV